MKRKAFISFLFLLPLVFCASAQTGKAEKIAEFEEFDCEALKVRTFYLVEGIKKTPQSKGYVIIYDGKYRKYKRNSWNFEYALPRANEVDSRVQLIKDSLLFMGYQPEDIVFIKGGVREKLTVEYFIVPKGAEIPKATPTLDKIKRRRGKVSKLSINFAAC